MSRSLTKIERHNGAEVGWYADDGSFEMIFYYRPGSTTFDVKNDNVRLKGMQQKHLKLDSSDMRIEDLCLAPWRDELFIHVIFRPWGQSTIEHYVQRLKLPSHKNVIYAADSTETVTTAYPCYWLSKIGFDHTDRNVILPFMDENRCTALLVRNLERPPSSIITDDVDLIECGFVHKDVWWFSASVNTPKGRRWFAQAFGKPRLYLPCVLPQNGRIRVLRDGSVQASKEPVGDNWKTYGTF